MGGEYLEIFGWLLYHFLILKVLYSLVVFSLFGLVMLFDVSFLDVLNKIKDIF